MIFAAVEIILGLRGALARVQLPGLNFMCRIFSTLMSLNTAQDICSHSCLRTHLFVLQVSIQRCAEKKGSVREDFVTCINSIRSLLTLFAKPNMVETLQDAKRYANLGCRMSTIITILQKILPYAVRLYTPQ